MTTHSTFRGSALAACVSLCAVSGQALTLEDCDRTTHPSHGGEDAQRDFGAGWVGFREWWSQEGVYTDLLVANCETGETLRTRVREERVTDRAPFDRTRQAERVISRHMDASPAFFHLGRMADGLRNIGEDTVVFRADTEHCACAALYPDLIGDKTPFEEIG